MLEASVVDQHLDRPVTQRGETALDVRLRSDIERVRFGLALRGDDLRRGLTRAVEIRVRRDNRVAFQRETKAEAAPESAAGAGDEDAPGVA